MQPTLPGATIDFSRYSNLRAAARTDGPGTLAEVADEFEALFVELMLKAAREAQLDGGLFDSSELDTYQEMLDQQIAITMARNHDLGIGTAMVRQLGEYANLGDSSRARDSAFPDRPGSPGGVDRAGFVGLLAPHARDAARRLGVSPRGLIAQAALETGWGRHVIRHPDGRSSHNYFGIKADQCWAGETVRVPTTEFIDGRAVTVDAAFRSYDGAAEAFDDYVDFIRANPRYESVLDEGADDADFARRLARAGYATDPDYADKIIAILNTGGWDPDTGFGRGGGD